LRPATKRRQGGSTLPELALKSFRIPEKKKGVRENASENLAIRGGRHRRPAERERIDIKGGKKCLKGSRKFLEIGVNPGKGGGSGTEKPDCSEGRPTAPRCAGTWRPKVRRRGAAKGRQAVT